MTEQLSMADLCTSAPVKLAHDRVVKKAAKVSKEDLFDFQCRQFRLPPYTRQAMFAKQAIGRRWMFDFCWQQYMLAVEIEGLVVQRVNGQLQVRGRHATIQGFVEDCVKYNTAALLGWTVLRFPQALVNSREAIEMTMRVLAARGWDSQSTQR